MQLFDEDMGELFRKASAEIRLKPQKMTGRKYKESLLPDPVLYYQPTEYSMVSALNADRSAEVAFLIFGMVHV